MEQYALIHEKKKLPKGFVPFKKGHGKKKGKEDSKDKKKNPFASLKKESAMSGDDMQLQKDAGINEGSEEYEIDNRDTSTTTLRLRDGTEVDVDPFELMINLIENAGTANEGMCLDFVNKIREALDGNHDHDSTAEFRQRHADGDQDAINWGEQ